MLWGVSEMLNAAVTNLSDAGALEILPPGNLSSAAQLSELPFAPGSFEVSKM